MVASSSTPLLEKFRLKGDGNIVVFSNSAEQVSSHPEVVRSFSSLAWSYLELALARHSFWVLSRYLDSSIQACLVVSIHDRSPKAGACSNCAIVGALSSWKSTAGPAERLESKFVLGFKQSVFLLESKPRFISLHSIKDLGSKVTEVSVCWLLAAELIISPHICVTEDNDVIFPSERISKDSHWFEDNFRVVRWGLVSGASVIVPLRDIL